MPDLDPFYVIGQPGELDWYTYLQLEELQRQRERDQQEQPAYAPPTTPLPEPAPAPVPEPAPVPPPPRVIPGAGIASGLLRGLVWFLFPQPTGPREHDELDEFDVTAPPAPPSAPPPAATDPIMPPNWNDLLEWPGLPRYVPLTPINLGPVEFPPGEGPEVIVNPPRVTPAPRLPDQPTIIELPDYVDLGIDLRPGPAPSPTSPPRIDPVAPDLFPDFEPDRIAEPARPGAPAPDVLSPPLPDWIGDPIGDPFAAPPLPSPPRLDPRTPANPGDFPDFLTPPTNDPLTFTPEMPLTQFKPDPFTPNKDACSCAKKKKKKKQDRKDRSVCYRGTYYETKRGLSKVRTEEVPCSDHPPKKEHKPREKKPRKPKLKPGQFPGLGFLGNNLFPSLP